VCADEIIQPRPNRVTVYSVLVPVVPVPVPVQYQVPGIILIPGTSTSTTVQLDLSSPWCGVVCIYTTNFLSDILNLLPNFYFELAEIRYAFFSISPPKIVDTHHIIPKSMVVENPLLDSRKSTTVQ
jgi:hypothetical protein